MTSLYSSSCCHAALDSYKDTECPDCGEPCVAEARDIEPPDSWDDDHQYHEMIDHRAEDR